MKSTFFHVGVNRTMSKKYNLQEPQVKADGSIPYVPLPGHHDPNFEDLTYGDPFGRLARFESGDVAFFIESGTINKDEWGYYLIAYFVAEAICTKHKGSWTESPSPDQMCRIIRNAHEIRKDFNYTIILGDKKASKLLFDHPLRISKGQDACPTIKRILKIADEPTCGYWFKRWRDNKVTADLLSKVNSA
jgi:hypothetical protein